MNADHWMIAALIILNIAQFIFWARQNQTLVNKLMCRDLSEYKYVMDNQSAPKVKEEKSFDEYEEEIEEAEVLKELNGTFSLSNARDGSFR